MFKVISQKLVTNNRTDKALKVLRIPKKPKKEIFKAWLEDKVINFCKVTSLHGYIHTVKKEYHPFERWLWVVVSFIALVTAVILLWISYNWTSETPTTTVIESTNYPTYNLPFPAVTICGMNKISKSLAFQIAKDMWVIAIDLLLRNKFGSRWTCLFHRKRPNNLTDEDVANNLRLLLHFRGSGSASDKEYQTLNDVRMKYSFQK